MDKRSDSSSLPVSGQKLPTIYLPHGGGPWPWMDFATDNPYKPLIEYLQSIPRQLKYKPKAILMISAHWVEPQFTVMSNLKPDMVYDYYGFPEKTYEVKYSAAGSMSLALRTMQLLKSQAIDCEMDSDRGFDHGCFVPLAVMYPNADIPVVQLSIKVGFDPSEHLAVGRALAPLRSEGILILGSGNSYHNLRGFTRPTATPESQAFDTWLTDTVTTSDHIGRNSLLLNWSQAPAARLCHPAEDHLIPLMVNAGAAEMDLGRRVFSDLTRYAEGLEAIQISGYHFGEN